MEFPVNCPCGNPLKKTKHCFRYVFHAWVTYYVSFGELALRNGVLVSVP